MKATKWFKRPPESCAHENVEARVVIGKDFATPGFPAQVYLPSSPRSEGGKRFPVRDKEIRKIFFVLASNFRYIGNAIADLYSAKIISNFNDYSGGYIARLCGSTEYENIDSVRRGFALYVRTVYRVGKQITLFEAMDKYFGPLDDLGNPVVKDPVEA